MHKCNDCLFIGNYQDMGASTPLCTRCNDLCEAIKEYEKTEPCKWHITKLQIIAMQREGKIELKPFIPAGTPRAEAREVAQKLNSISKAASLAIDAMAQAIINLAKNIENGGNKN